jgi:hypothetical protein
MPEIILPEDVRTIPLTQGKVTIIDGEDWGRVSPFKWWAQRDLNTWYARRQERTDVGKNRLVSLHRFLIDAPAGTYVDHINGDGLDNRKSNLRIATHSQNHQNRRRPGKGRSRFKCVNRNGKWWRSYICVTGKMIWLGRFATEEEAARAYDAAAIQHFGQFACTNADLYGDY